MVDLPKLVFCAPIYSDVMNCCVRAVFPTPGAPSMSTRWIRASPLEDAALHTGEPPAEFSDEFLDREDHSFSKSKSDPILFACNNVAPRRDTRKSPSFTIPPLGVILKDLRRYGVSRMGSSGMLAMRANRSGGMSFSSSSMGPVGVVAVDVAMLSSQSEPASD